MLTPAGAATPPWSDFFDDSEFSSIVLKRRKTTFQLFGVTLFFFFSVPLISYGFPSVFKWEILGINLGFVYVMAQYAIGGFIAWVYVRALRRIDEEMRRVVLRIWPEGRGAGA